MCFSTVVLISSTFNREAYDFLTGQKHRFGCKDNSFWRKKCIRIRMKLKQNVGGERTSGSNMEFSWKTWQYDAYTWPGIRIVGIKATSPSKICSTCCRISMETNPTSHSLSSPSCYNRTCILSGLILAAPHTHARATSRSNKSKGYSPITRRKVEERACVEVRAWGFLEKIPQVCS